ncbi:MAG: selenocysteine-specific translation elongation factor [Halieaceae bacterium]|nr:selenocysteine-specific translation elongation factor [Halieaceae bacterium]
MIVATAGHVDHGKTSLIKHITGVDTDRLEEEKRRGLSISLGYAYLPQETGLPVGFIDVPGHHRFINTMIAGVGGIDLAVLVVAADDGVMPQTREHLDVLRLLGVQRIVPVITKIDRVDEQRLETVENSVGKLLQNLRWKQEVLFRVNNQNGFGVDSVRAYLLRCATQCDMRNASGVFRLSMDRVFHIKGSGLVVTGTVTSGSISTGDVVLAQPDGASLRVRGLRVHDRDAPIAIAGQRCALNLGGKGEVARGGWLLGSDAAPPSKCLDVHLQLLATLRFSLKHLTPVKLYLGSQRVTGRLARYKRETSSPELKPGDAFTAHLLLDEPVPAFTGQRYLLRDASEETLLGGGVILDPQGIYHGKMGEHRLAYLEAMSEPTPDAALRRLLEQDQVVDLALFQGAWNIPQETAALPVTDAGRAFDADSKSWLTSKAKWSRAEQELVFFVAGWHQEHPHETGISPGMLRRAMAPKHGTPLVLGVLSACLKAGVLNLSEGFVLQAGFIPHAEGKAANDWRLIEECLLASGCAIPLLSEIAASTGMDLEDVKKAAQSAVKQSLALRVSNRRYALPSQLLELATGIIRLDTANAEISVVAAKQQWGTGRNLTIEILEYFDDIRFTQRRNNARVVLDESLPARLFSA